MRRRIMLVALGMLAAGPSSAFAQRALLDFYPVARDRAASPPEETALKVVCEKELTGDAVPEPYRKLRLTLVSAGTPRVLLAVFSRKRLGDLKEAISLHVRYDPLPTALPRPSGSYDWGYLYDRNGDGRVDYLVYLQNAHPVLPDSIPADFPTVEPAPEGRYRISLPLLHQMIDLGQMVFRHYADDNFDGRVDGVVMEEFDKVRPMFVRDWLLFRRSQPDGAVDQGWAFRHAPADTTRVLDRGAGGYQVASPVAGESPTPVLAVFDRATERLAVINAVLGQCRIGPEALDRGE